MSSWGYKDNAAIKGTVTGYTQNVNIVGASSEFLTNVKAGDYLTIVGQKYQVNNVTSNTALTLTSPLSSATSGATAYLQQGPKYVANVNAALTGSRQGNLTTIQNVYGVDLSEMNTKQVKSTTLTAAGAGYTTAAKANTTVTISTSGASQPTTNATATLNYTSSTESSNASHTGWVTYKTYVDAKGSVREKSEVLVAMSKSFTAATAGDAADDTIFPDS